MKSIKNTEQFIRAGKPHIVTGRRMDSKILHDSFEAIEQAAARTTEQLDEKILNAVLSPKEEYERTQSAQMPPKIWRIAMHSKLTKLAAAALIALAAIIGINQFAGGSVTFAQVIGPILNARTVVLDYVIGEGPDALEMHDIVIGSRIRRTMSNVDKTKILDPRVRHIVSNMDHTMILDLEDARMLTLISFGVTKIASYNDLQGTGQEEVNRNFLDSIRNIVSEVKDDPDADIQDLGEKEINGQKAVGFYVKGPNGDLTIWANKKTSLPIRMEFAEGKTPTVVIKNIEFDVPLEESLVSMEVPAGYTLKDNLIHINKDTAPNNLPEEQLVSNATEEDLVESLRIWAEIIVDGAFPDAIGTDHFIKQAAVLGYKIGSLRLPVSEGEQLIFKFSKGTIFLQELELFGGKWGYSGKGVKLGDTDKIILWYQPLGSNTYRAIYGDLRVAEVAEEDLPK